MKYIFDFDDVLFNNTSQFKPHMFSVLAEAGVLEEDARAYYREVREKEFSLKDFIKHFGLEVGDLYEKIMVECSNFRNTELMEMVQKVGKENCYIVSNGENKFNWDKINYSGIGNFFDPKHIYVVPGPKKDKIKEICEKNKNEQVIFVDDKTHFLDEIDEKFLADYPNLRKLHYKDEKEHRELLAIMMSDVNSELLHQRIA